MLESISRILLLLFASSAKVVSVGTRVANPTTDISSSCSTIITKTDPRPVISSPNFGIGNYPLDTKCGWLVEASTDLADITIKVDYFDVEPSKLCSKFDYLMVYAQNDGDNDWAVIENDEGFCGKLTIPPITVNAKRMFIKFVSDITKNYPGFNATLDITVTEAEPIIDCLGLMNTESKKPVCNSSVSVLEGNTVIISCRASLALPPAGYTWMQVINETVPIPINSSKIKAAFKNGDIILQNLALSDSGTYSCLASNRRGNNSGTFELIVSENCLCPKFIHTSWYSYPPYIYYTTASNGSLIVKGIFPAVLKKMINEVCGKCARGHGPTEIVWDQKIAGQLPNVKKGLGDVKNDVEELDSSLNGYDMVFPLSNGKSSDTYRNKYCVAILDSPGTALIVTKEDENASSKAMFNSILGAWPILVLVLVMATLAGIIMWILETYWNEKQFPRSFTSGMGEGFWWAFVTMTTVGYGDIAPIGVPGRLFAVIWILTGLILIAIFTGVITTSLTVTAMSNDLMLYGATVGALNNTAEFRMGVIRNAKMKNYSSYETLKVAMTKNDVQGMLLDAYVAAYHIQSSKDFRVNNIFETSSKYCIVLGNEMNRKAIFDKLVEYTTAKKADILKDIETNSFKLSEPGASAAEESAKNIFNPNNTLFLSSLITTTSILVVFLLLGVLFEYWYLRPRKRMIEAAKNLEMVESREVKEMAKRAKMLKEYLLLEVNEFYDRWSETLTSLTKKHKLQQEVLLARGASAKVSDKKPILSSANSLQYDNGDGLDGSSNGSSGSRTTLPINRRAETKNL